MNDMETAETLQRLQTGELEMQGLLPWSSNYTFLVHICDDERRIEAVYKPRRGERPLWDFAQGTLCQRERAAFLVSDALGWGLVPPTVLRDGPHGLGSIQFFVEHDPECHYFTFEGEAAYREQLQQLALFDVLVNNADRKSGHVLLAVPVAVDAAGNPTDSAEIRRLWAIDHGICFHTDYKLRTVIWEFAGEPIPPALLADLNKLKEQLCEATTPLSRQLKGLLSTLEIIALHNRLDQLLKRTSFPQPGPGRHYPWPPV
jgi:uncharacterized repeat protein (TIGR03843 family)